MEGTGKLTGDKRKILEGKLKQAEGEIQDKFGQAKKKVERIE